MLPCIAVIQLPPVVLARVWRIVEQRPRSRRDAIRALSDCRDRAGPIIGREEGDARGVTRGDRPRNVSAIALRLSAGQYVERGRCRSTTS